MRRENWPTELANYIDKRSKMPFEWGTNDCCTFACSWVHILVGFDPSVEFRCYHDAKSALKLLKEEGGVEVIAVNVCQQWGWPECPPLQAQRGDVVLMDTPQGAAMGICLGSRCAFPGVDGITFKLTGEVRRAWRIN